MTSHQMVVLGQDRDGLVEAECVDCGKHVLVGRGRYIVLDQGDFHARRSFSTGGAIDLTMRVDPDG